MSLIYQEKKFLDIVEIETIEFNVNDQRLWRKGDNTSMMLIHARLDEKVMFAFVNCKITITMWRRLSIVHLQKANENKHIVQ